MTGTTTKEKDSDVTSIVFRHRTCRAFVVQGFQFKDFHMEIKSKKKAQEFRDLAATLPDYIRVNIEEFPENHKMYQPKPVGPKAVRGGVDSSQAPDKESDGVKVKGSEAEAMQPLNPAPRPAPESPQTAADKRAMGVTRK